MENIKHIIESIIFISDEPVTLDKIRKMLPETDIREIKQGIIDLVEEFETRQGGFYLREIAGGYQFRTRPEYRQWVSYFIQPKPVRLSKAALETLAIVAYRQPIIRADIEHIRGVDSGGVLRMLMERKLIRTLGRKDIPGRPLIYATTKHFLELFDLKDLSDLPSLKEIEEFGRHEPDDVTDTTPAVSADQDVKGDDTPQNTTGEENAAEEKTDVQPERQKEIISESELALEIDAIVIPRIEEIDLQAESENTGPTPPAFNYAPSTGASNSGHDITHEIKPIPTQPAEEDMDSNFQPKPEFKK